MANFLTRVELHQARGSDYDELHRLMAAQNFRRHIQASDGRRYQLPTAEYWCHGNLSASDVREIARAAASKTGLGFWIIVAEYSSASWYLHEV